MMPDGGRAALPLPCGRTIVGNHHENRLTLSDEQGPVVQLRVSHSGTQLVLEAEEGPRHEPDGFLAAVYWLLSMNPDCERLQWMDLSVDDVFLQTLTDRGLLSFNPSTDCLETRRDAFWQQDLWCMGGTPSLFPETLTMTHQVRHPVRPPKPRGEVYRRYDPRLQSWISFRTLDPSQDLARFNRWQNKPRVNEFWEEAGTLETHRSRLDALAADPHCLQLIGCFDNEPFGFFDVYWAREDRIGPWCDAGFHDRGIHMLVGEDHHRGPHKVACWLPSLVHYLFLDDPRTARIVSEPRADNDRMIHYLMETGFSHLRNFSFPHKRAALMALSRENFLDQCRL